MPNSFGSIFKAIQQDPMNQIFTNQQIDPLYSASSTARLLIIGQAPGKRAQDSRMYWNDPSGDRLRQWLGISRQSFYDTSKVAILPMDFYFPGTGKSGDLPPRKGFAEKWHPLLLEAMPNIELTLLIGAYATKHYLHLKSGTSLTSVVKNYQIYLPSIFPLVHPSPRNQIWMKKNPWFEQQVLPDLKKEITKRQLN